ncbi:nucleoside deaminase [Candidatus Arthromitus sp. SFB-rat-Yit]|uniref:nucleoside deaminase n=1 Tax=Candidatus Arthromitus sp. SFB-rat-Yit TaxID=1041504 RepID=UPI000227A634|nr:nucleoside deaminase [Candidatus Arthromitus sp. SFB-rat-Yit]BAK80594.1 cytidine/deoxycytidylate deaminase family protein [Candidatus Arthromitus sp. SFB-rat-Yit]
MNVEYFTREMLKEAYKAYKLNEVPIGCLIVKDNKIISKSHNTKHSTNIPINHAEILSIIQSCKNLNSLYLNNCSIFISLEPCAMCAGAIIESRIKNIFIGSPNPFNGFFSKNYYFYPKDLNIKWLNDSRCEFIINRFFIKKRKKL